MPPLPFTTRSPDTCAPADRPESSPTYIRNDNLVSALHDQAFAAISASPGARACYDDLKAREIDHADALRRVASRMAGILHGCLKTGTAYDEETARGHRSQPAAAA